MALFAAGSEFSQHARPDRCLGIDKARELEEIADQRPAFSADKAAMEAQSFSLQPFFIASS